LLPDQRTRNRLNLAFARHLQLPQTRAGDLLRTLVALPLVIELQARKFVGVHGVAVSPKLAVGRGLRYQQRAGRPTNSQFRISLGGRGGGRSGRSGSGLCLDLTRARIPGATGNRHRARYDEQRHKPSGARGRAQGAHVFQLKTRHVDRLFGAALIAMRTLRSTLAWPPGQAWRSCTENLNRILIITMNQT